jgi:hypothetical protein
MRGSRSYSVGGSATHEWSTPRLECLEHAEQGRSGGRYLLGGESIFLRDFGAAVVGNALMLRILAFLISSQLAGALRIESRGR